MKNNNNSADKGRTLPVDPNLPRWICQNCRHNLYIVGVDSYTDKFLNDSSSRSGMQGSSIHGVAGSVLGSTRMDHSFVVLPKQRNQVSGVPPRPRGGELQPDTSQSGKAMEESFVVLPPPAASLYKSDSTSDGGRAHLPSSEGGTGAPMQPNNSGFTQP